MRKLYDSHLFESIREYLVNYLPRIRCRSNDTVKTSKIALKLLLDFFENALDIDIFTLTIKDLTQANIRAFVDWLVTVRGSKASTVNQRLARVKAFLTYLSKHGDPSDIAMLVEATEVSRLPETSGKIPKCLTMEQVRLLLNVPNQIVPIEFRDSVFMTLMYDTGCRDNELRSLLLKDVTLGVKFGTIRVLGKGNKERLVPVSVRMVILLQKYLAVFHAENDTSSLLFYTESKDKCRRKMSNDNSLRIFRKYSKRVAESVKGYPHVHPHKMRHSRAQNLYDAGMSLPLICDWLGHASMETTRVYARSSLSMKRKAIEKATLGKEPLLVSEQPLYSDNKETIKKLYGL